MKALGTSRLSPSPKERSSNSDAERVARLVTGTFRPRPSSSPMPHYFFDFWEDGNLIADDEGTDAPDFETAKDEAVVDLAELMKEILTAGGSHELKLILRDENGEELLELALNYQEKILTKIFDVGPSNHHGPKSNGDDRFYVCSVCGQEVDQRDIRQVLWHAQPDHEPLELDR
ncbi:DUF6894 family protein [Mesorhizobium caraganae]|uniref:DUF6894 family protein n=1 Tax=Mesorhizobium caraganae TaxID=483206 RepID=UPI00177E0B13|nr:hypothetical protein [Mesorhizobium caraganae]